MRVLGLVLLAGAAVGVACSDSTGGGGGGGRSTTITVSNNRFTPSPDTVPAGTITFSWSTGPHNVTWVNGPAPLPADIPDRSSGTQDVTVQTGTYNYHCTLHGGMTGRIVVE